MNKDIINNYALQIIQLAVEHDEEDKDVFDKSCIVDEIYALAFQIKELTDESS